MATKKKILVVAGNLSHLDQFVIHGLFKELSDSAAVILALSQSEFEGERWAKLPSEFKNSFEKVVPYKYDSKSKKTGSQLGEASTFRYRNSSSGYMQRVKNKYFAGLQIPSRWKTIRGLLAIFRSFGEVCARVVNELPSLARGSKLFFWFWSRVAVSKICKNCGLAELAVQQSPDVIVVLMQRQAGFVVAAIDAGARAGIPTLLIPVKWDNASSKSPLVKKPTRMLVYNQQLVEVCSHMHKMPTNSISAIGSVEVGAKRVIAATSQSKNLVLIGSTADASSSVPWLNCVSDVLSQKSESKNQIKTIWRPYPTGDSKSLSFMNEFVASHKQFELDDDIKRGMSHRAQSISFDDISAAYFRYCELLNSAVVVVSEGTSAIVDARARGIPVIFPAFKKDAVIGSQWCNFMGWEHLRGLLTTTGVFIAEDETELEQLLTDFLENPRRIEPDNSGENIFVDHRSYAQRVLDAVSDVLAEKSAVQKTS
ncbi:MAG: hypothetical protein NT119_12160 [Actinobacteria bacterium]|nr:hypothetical protein [Actinomycetota bacterium]